MSTGESSPLKGPEAGPAHPVPEAEGRPLPVPEGSAQGLQSPGQPEPPAVARLRRFPGGPEKPWSSRTDPG